MNKTIPCCVCASLLLSACSLVEVTEETPPEDTQQQQEQEQVPETSNVTYTGTVQPAGISVYQQGSHRLTLDGGKFILLESDILDLNGYVNESVQVFGALRPTVEAGGMIMRVEQITLMDGTSTSAAATSTSSSVSSEDAVSSEESSQSTESSENSESSDVSEAGESEESATSSADTSSTRSEGEGSESSASSEASVETSTASFSAQYMENLEVMKEQDYSAANWTQSYCSSHVEFCVPVHRNFWFKSFGATESTLWHVEFSVSPVEELGDGPIVVNLNAGSKTDIDGTVEVSNGKAVGYKEWTFGRHFTIEADAKLEAAVRYMVENITAFTE